jgi:signal transduction histidine kinase
MPAIDRAAAADAEARRRRTVLALVAVAGAVATGLTVAIVLASPEQAYRGLVAVARALVVAVPVGVGLWAWATRPDRRFGPLLVLSGFVWSLTGLTESDSSLAYSTGRVAEWLAEPLLLLLVLTFPSGALRRRIDRTLMAAAVLTVALLYLPSALLLERFPEPAPIGWCHVGCPPNAFMVVDTQPAFADTVLRPLREVVTVAIFAAVVVVLARRVQTSTPLMRRALVPVLSVAALRAAMFVLYLPVRRIDPDSAALEAIGWIVVLCLPAIAIAFVVGLVRARLLAGAALQNLALRLAEHPEPAELTQILRETTGDPTLELAYWVAEPEGRWVDARGRPVRPPDPGSGRVLTEVREGDRLVAALVHDAALEDTGRFVQAAGALALSSLENQRLSAKVDASLLELQESRARIQAAADSERQRIERDLHDGAQQRLVALRIKLGLAADTMRDDPARGAKLVHDLGEEAEAALEEVRALAQGVYPSLLADEGLPEALRALGRRTTPAARVSADGVGRLPREIESAVYFCCLEALQNVAKHASGARTVEISLHADGDLRFEVRDDGAGFSDADVRAGLGFTSMRDRIAAVGGRLSIRSEPGVGTTVAGSVPLETA